MNDKTRTKLGWLIAICMLASVTASPVPAQTSFSEPARAPSAFAPATLQAHSIVGAAAKGVAAKLREIYAGRTDVQITDSNAGHVVVSASPSVQHEVAHWLAAEGLIATDPEVVPASAQQAVGRSEPERAVTQSWQLRNLAARDFEAKLKSTWGVNLQASQDSVGDVATFRFPPTKAGTASIMVDRRANTATVSAPASAAGSWQRLMTILDDRPKSAEERTSIVPLIRADPNTIRRAISILQQVFSAGEVKRKQHIGQFVSMLFQPEAGAQPAPAPPAPTGDMTSQAMASGGASAASMEAIARINNVQIEILDDVIVVRGRREDVERVMQIIEQIERQSIQFKPEIEIYYLKHVDSTALTDMINQVYAAAFSRQGTVTIQPLQRPNAVLLIGRKENIPSLIELISKLDQPAPTDGEFKIFRLQNMSAIDAERTIRQFFVTRPPTVTDFRPGLGTRALVIADYRSNSLLVQAAPRDMVEIVTLIEKLDVPDSTISYEVRVFKLRNSIAETLAPVLEEAITAAQASTNAQTVTGAAGQNTAARATPPAVNLQFLRVGPDGEQLIKSGIMANVRITADTRSNSLIVIGPTSAMGLMSALIEQLDRLPATEAQIKVFTIRNGDATALAEMLTNLFGQPQQANQQAPGQASPTGAGDSAIVPLRFSVDQRTNSIIASGNAGDLNVIYHILTRLDEGDIRQRRTEVYRLRNAPAQDVSNALQQLLQQQLQLIQISPELVTPVETLERQVIVVPEIVTNSLIVSATERYFKEISRIIETLDRRPPMVVIQVVLAEVTLTDNEEFGVEWGLQDSLMFDRSSSATGNRFNFNGTNPSLPNDAGAVSLATAPRVATQALSNFVLGRSDSSLGFGGLVLSASSRSVSVLLRALESSSRAQIISRPQVQTLDNLPAFVQVGALVPRITGAATTGLSVVPILNDINVGLIMQVTPRTSPDGTIVMQVYAEKSTVGPDATGIPVTTDSNGNVIKSPQIPRTLAQTTVSARSGQTVVLGGLITNDQEENSRRIPYLADIPVVGRMFRFDTVLKKRTELLIILTPFLVTSEEQIDWINARESERMSWCVADIVNIHGPVAMGGNPAFNAGPTPLIFPDLQPGAVPPPEGIQPTPTGSITPGYPAGPMPYQEGPPRMPSSAPVPPGSTGPLSNTMPPGAASGAPLPAPAPGPLPSGYPPGPMPYQNVPPGPGIPPPPPPGPGLGTAQPDNAYDYLVPQPASLAPPNNSHGQGPLSPPYIQPASPPAGTPLAGWPMPPMGQQQPLPPQQGMQPASMLPPDPGNVAPAEFQQPLPR